MGIFNTVPVKKPKHSAFDLSYNNFFTCNMGELIPSLVLPVIPGDRIQYSPTFQVRFAPMVNPVFGDIYAKQECFFVPYRLVWNGWKSFITQFLQKDIGVSVSNSEPRVGIPSSVPVLSATRSFDDSTSGTGYTVNANHLAFGRLCDFFGFSSQYREMYSVGVGGQIISNDSDNVNILPFRAYNLIWNEYYRDEFVDSELTGCPDNISVSSYSGLYRGDANEYASTGAYKVRRRRWAKDYFTTATPYPQYGSDGAKVTVNSTGSSVDGSVTVAGAFSIAQFRVANALQRFLERTNIGGGRYNEFILAHFGCMPTDATIQRPEFLGSVTAPVQVNAVANTAGVGASSTPSISDAQGSLAGTASAVGTKFCFRRSFKEYGVILGLFSVVPRPVYVLGMSKHLMWSTPTDFCFPEYASVGDQEVYREELLWKWYSKRNRTVFGYQQRYAEYKFHNDEAHGDFILDDKLPTYTFARFFSNAVLNSDFLECNPRTNCFVTLIQRGMADNPISDTCWVQLRNNIKAIRPLPRYSTPTL